MLVKTERKQAKGCQDLLETPVSLRRPCLFDVYLAVAAVFPRHSLINLWSDSGTL